MTGSTKQELIDHLLAHAVRTGEFTLKSGRTSTWFCDGKQTVCRAEGLLLVADLALETIPDDVTAIGGLTAGADPVAAASPPGAVSRVVVCEDVVTRGTSPMEAAEVVRELGAEPVMVMPVVDRGGTCGALAEAAGLDFRPLVTALELGFPYEGP